MIKDRYGVEVNIGDECVIAKYGNCYKVKIHKITDVSVQYLDYDEGSNPTTYSIHGNSISWSKRLPYNQHYMIKI